MSVNRLSLDITDAKKAEVASSTDQLTLSTKDLTVVVSAEEIKHMSPMADGRLPFVEKAAEYTVSNPEFLPPSHDETAFQRNLKNFKITRSMERPVRQVADNLQNTKIVCGVDAYAAARAFYKVIKLNAELGTPGAQTIYEDLKPLYESKSSPDDKEDE